MPRSTMRWKRRARCPRFRWDATWCSWMALRFPRRARWIRCWRFGRPSRNVSTRVYRRLRRAPRWAASIANNWSRKSRRRSERFRRQGSWSRHLDTHKHAHIFPEILKAMLRAARICGVRAIRSPFVPMKAIMAQRFAGKRTLMKRYGQVRMLNAFAGKFRRQTARAGLRAPDGVIGVIETGSMDGNSAAAGAGGTAGGNVGVGVPPGVCGCRSAGGADATGGVARAGAGFADFFGIEGVSGEGGDKGDWVPGSGGW